MNNTVLTGSILSSFLKLAIPSILGLIAITTASIVDGMFIGHYVNAEGLAAINLLLPYLSLIFGIALMFSIGGAVRAGFYIGQNEFDKSSAIFSQCLIVIVGIGLLFALFSWLFSDAILSLLGFPETLISVIEPYFHIISLVVVVQITTMVMYYFIRQDGSQTLGSVALITGSIINIVLDFLFIAVFSWELEGAAAATAIAQTIQLVILSSYFFKKKSKLKIRWQALSGKDLAPIVMNGGSEFINELSAGIVILVLNWLMISRIGIHGVAAFAVINYLIFISLMLYYGIADALHLVISQNYGAKKYARIQAYLITASICILVLSLSLVILLVIHPDLVSGLFLDNDLHSTHSLSQQFIGIIWPLFLINGINIIISVYLTAIGQAIPSMTIALLRGLILPTSLLVIMSLLLTDDLFLIALPVSEWVTFIVAIVMLCKYRPTSLLRKE